MNASIERKSKNHLVEELLQRSYPSREFEHQKMLIFVHCVEDLESSLKSLEAIKRANE